jgi:small subunit ribosomal protein S7
MERGKKTAAEKIVYGAFDIIRTEAKQDPRHVFNKAMKRVSPIVEVRSRRIGGGNYQVPSQVRGDRRFTLGCRWILTAVRAKKGKSTAEKLAAEIIAASNGEGSAVKKRDDVHRMAEANKAFAHFAR